MRHADYLVEGDGAERLVVLVHGYRGSPQKLLPLAKAIRGMEGFANADIFAPAMPFDMFSSVPPEDVVALLVRAIDERWSLKEATGRPYERIWLVGHSMGGVFVRKAYVCASGQNPQAPLEREIECAFEDIGAAPAITARPWAKVVERIVLLAAINRGWAVSHHMGVKTMIVWSFGSFIGRLRTLFLRRRPLVFALKRGSPFIAQLRVQWIRMRQRALHPNANQPGGAVTVQLLGSVDDIVAPSDSVDIVSGSDFYYIDVPYSSHATVLDVCGDSLAQTERHKALSLAFSSIEGLERNRVPAADEMFVVNEKVTDVIFVMHGIRDYGHWTQKIARKAIRRAASLDGDRVVVSETSTYGYFPMLPFILPGTRRRKVEWLMDEYAEAVARYPEATFAYMGHSNGTYLVARALQLYPVAKFTNIVLVGSVVVTDYDWQKLINTGRVKRVLNYTATGDMVVAFFPKLFQKPRIQDLGSAGHDGFTQANAKGILQVGFVKGGHSAARQEAEWDSIAEFLLNGTDVGSTNTARSRNPLVTALAWVPMLVWVGLVGLIVAGGIWIWSIDHAGWRVFVFILYLWALGKVVTRV